jgi:hypothetical protein
MTYGKRNPSQDPEMFDHLCQLLIDALSPMPLSCEVKALVHCAMLSWLNSLEPGTLIKLQQAKGPPLFSEAEGLDILNRGKMEMFTILNQPKTDPHN